MSEDIPQLQGSKEWHKFRSNHIGSSDAAIILGISPWSSIGQLFDEKLGLRAIEAPSDAMERGTALEAEARLSFELETGIWMKPKVLVHPEYTWMSASLDGISDDGKHVLEIKCPGEKSHNESLKGKIPEIYIPQLQHIMSVTGHDKIFYYSYRNGLGKILTLDRDDDYISRLIQKEMIFSMCLDTGFNNITDFENQMDNLKNELYRILGNGDDTA